MIVALPGLFSYLFCENITNLNVNKYVGLDHIGSRILKCLLTFKPPNFTFIVHKSIISGEFPSSWKEAKVKPLFKSDPKDGINKYRPISILPTVSKLIEKWVDRQF